MKRWILLAIMGAFVAVPVVFWAQTVSGAGPLSLYFYHAGRLATLVGFMFVFFQFVFSSKIKWIERGIGLDRMFNIHRISGRIGIALILVHPVFLILADIVRGSMPSLPRFAYIGLAALTIFVITVAAVLLYRKLDLKYETWKRIHQVNYVALPLAFVHSLRGGSDLARQPLRSFWFALAGMYGAILIGKVWNWVRLRRNPYQVAAVIEETHDVCSLHFEGKRVDYKPGQFLIVQLVRDGRVSEPHPFTISASPTWPRLSISVKSVGDFTATIKDTTTSDQAYVDAPYGVFSFLNHDAPNLVFIAGGIGITPFISMLRYLRETKLERNVLLIWGNKTDDDIVFREELGTMVDEIPGLKVVHVMSRQEEWPGEKGYIDTSMLSKYMSDIKDPQVFLCGPPVMMDKVLASLHELGVPEGHIHYERFALR